MSFGFNSYSVQKRIPAVEKTFQTTDGGAGSLGYFNQQKKKKDKNDADGDTAVFSFSGDNEDTFGELKQEAPVGDLIKDLLSKIELFSDNI